MLRLERLKILKYRRIAPGTELHFSPRHNVLLGKNATGKTTLLELISHVARNNVSALRHEPFEIEFDLVSPGLKLSTSIRHEEVPISPGARRDGPARQRFNTTASLTIEPGGRHVSVGSAGTTLLEEDRPTDGASADLFSEAGIGWAIVDVLGSQHWDLFGACIVGTQTARFDEGADVFRDITEVFSLRAKHTASGVMMQCGVDRGLWPDDAFLDAAHTLDTQRLSRVELQSKTLDDLKVLLGLRAFTAFVDAIQTKHVSDDEIATTYGRVRFSCTRLDGSIDTNEFLSYGEKRLIALWWYLASTPHIAIIDELVNGLHHSWIEATMDKLGDRQSFLTSQNPLLMDYLGFESAEDVQRTFILCPGASEASGGRLPIRNLSAEEAERFQRAYAVGIQHVSEILRDQGLW